MTRIASQVSETKIGGYHLQEKLGAGGLGMVYKARDALSGKVVAIKVMPEELVADEVMRMRFAQECQVARKLDHPHIVRVQDFGLDGNKPYLVMEYVVGESLGQRLERDGPLSEAEAIRVIVQVGGRCIGHISGGSSIATSSRTISSWPPTGMPNLPIWGWSKTWKTICV